MAGLGDVLTRREEEAARQRYHLLLTADDRPVAHGWWADEATARDKMRDWVGEQGRPGVRVVLVDEETGETLATWPEEP